MYNHFRLRLKTKRKYQFRTINSIFKNLKEVIQLFKSLVLRKSLNSLINCLSNNLRLGAVFLNKLELIILVLLMILFYKK
jgi:hypothetical protein